MNLVDGKRLGTVGFAKIGTPYEDMDCQKFVEWCLRECGLNKDLGGSNAWYRETLNNGIILTPEECVKRYGKVPVGAFLFIHAYDGKEPEKYRKDGLGNASHIGLVTGTGKGAIHSSKTAGGVAESPFAGKTIKNGGWNCVGLYDKVSYGISGDGSGEAEPIIPDPEPEPDVYVYATVSVGEGQNVITRKGPGTGYSMSKAGRLPDGMPVTILEQKTNNQGEKWCRIRCSVNGVTWVCWMMGKFLTTSGGGIDGGEDGSGASVPMPQDGANYAELLEGILTDLENLQDEIEMITERIAAVVGRG